MIFYLKTIRLLKNKVCPLKVMVYPFFDFFLPVGELKTSVLALYWGITKPLNSKPNYK